MSFKIRVPNGKGAHKAKPGTRYLALSGTEDDILDWLRSRAWSSEAKPWRSSRGSELRTLRVIYRDEELLCDRRLRAQLKKRYGDEIKPDVDLAKPSSRKRGSNLKPPADASLDAMVMPNFSPSVECIQAALDYPPVRRTPNVSVNVDEGSVSIHISFK